MADDLRIKITAQLDNSKPAIDKLQSQLDTIAKKLKLTVGIDTTQLKEVSTQVKQIQNQIGKQGKGIQIVDEKGKSNVKELYKTLDDAVKKYSQLGTVKINQSLNPVTKDLEKFELSITKASGEVEKLKFQLASMIKGAQGLDGFALVGNSIADNTQAIREKQLIETQKINNKILEEERKLAEEMAKVREQSALRQFKERQKEAEAQAKVINKAIEQNHIADGDKVGRLTAFDGLYGTSEKQVLTTLKVNKAIGDQQVLASSLDRVTGKWSVTIKENATQQRVLSGVINKATGDLHKQKEAISDVSSRHMGMMEQMKIAMQRVPIWGISTGLIYGTANAVQSLVDRMVELDTLMVDINRVMDQPQFKMTELMNGAIEVSDQLSSKLTDVLTIAGEFARMGDYSNTDLLNMSSTAQVLQNISDLDATAAVDTLTAAMLNYNMTAEESIQIADQLNEVDNNFAISTKDLSDGIRKSASTAKTFGVDLQELTGYIAAIGSTTRESGAIVGNGLKTIISRITTIEGAEDALNSANVAMKDMQGNVRPVSDILSELAGNWSNLSAAQQQNMGVTLAGRYQLSRFYALMNNFSMATEATETALNSQGSAMREQAKYADSLEARLNRLDTAWNKLVVSASNAVVNDGFIAIVETLNDVLTMSSLVIDKIGVLSGVLGATATVVTLLSAKLKGFATALIFGTGSMTGAQVAATGLSAGMSRLQIATVGARTALMGLASATIVGAVFVGIGFALEKLIKKYSDAQQAQQDFEQSQQKSIDALTTNKQQTEELVKSYEKLSNERGSDTWNTDKEKEYLQIQQQLGDLYPTLIDSIDTSGQYRLKDVEAIDAEIASTQELIELKKEEARITAQETFKDDKKSKSDIEDQIKKKNEELANFEDYGNSRLGSLTKADRVGNLENINKIKQEILSLESELSTASAKINDDALKIADSFREIEIDQSITRGIEDFVNKLDLSKLNPEELESYSKKLAKYTDDMQKAYNKGNEEGFDKARDSLVKYTEKTLDTDIKLKSLTITFDDVKSAIERLNNATYSGSDGMEQMEVDIETVSDAINNAKGDFESLSKIIIDLAKAGDTDLAISTAQKEAYEALSDEVAPLNELLEKMAEGKQISAAEAMDLIAKEEELANAISIENGQVKINQEAVLNLRNAKVSSYSDMMKSIQQEAINTANATISKLKNYGIEIEAIQNLQDAKKRLAELEDERAIANSGMGSWDTRDQINKTYKSIKDVSDLADNIDNLTGLVSKGLTDVGTSTEKTSESTKDLSEAKEHDIYVTDEYAKSLENANLALEELNRAQDKMAKYSNEYQQSLQNEIDLLKQKKELLESQAKSLQSQIDSGYIQPTGKVSVSSVSGVNYSGSLVDRPLNTQSSLTASQINEWINSKAPINSLMRGMGEVFIEAAKQSGLDVGYLVAHAAHETGWGTSNIARNKKNFYGIGAFDASPYASAYGYNDIAAGIIEGAKWISRNYTNGSYGQDTLQKMRFNNGIHQYATDPNWANAVANIWDGYAGAMVQSANTVATDVASTVSSVATKSLNGWGGKFTSGYGMRGGTMHRGIDIDGEIGDRLDANVSGEVIASGTYGAGSGYNNYGNVVVVRDSEGMEHLYAHLEDVLVSVGDQVTAGQQVGTIGNTGKVDKSTGNGSHLHYEVRTGGYGTDVDPTPYYNGMVSTASVGTDAADTAQSIDNAKSEVIDIKSEILDIQSQIEQLYMAIVQNNINWFEQLIKDTDNGLQILQINTDNIYDKTSDKYRFYLGEQLKYHEIKKQYMKDEIAYIESEITSNANLTASQKEQLTGVLSDKLLVFEQMEKAAYDLNQEIIKNHLDELIDDIADKVEKLNRNMQDLEETFKTIADGNEKGQLMGLEDQMTALQDYRLQVQRNIIDHIKLQETLQGNSEALAQNNEELNKWRDELASVDAQIYDLNMEIYFQRVEYILEDISDRTEEIRRNISRIDNAIDMTDPEDESGLLKLQEDKLNSLREEQAETTATIERLKALGETLEEGSEAWDENNKKIKENEDALSDIEVAIYDQQQTIKDVYDSIADSYIESMKDAIDAKRDAELEAIEDAREAEQEAYEDRMEWYDDELNKLDELYNKKMREIDDQESKDDYEKELAKKQEERQEIQSELNRIQLDDSTWANKRRKELLEELADKEEEINEFMHDRNLELTKQALQDERDEIADGLDEQREMEQDAFKDKEDAWNDHIDFINQKYDNLIQDERYWSSVRQSILDGDIQAFSAQIDTITQELMENNELIGESITNNIVDTLAKAKENLAALNGMGYQDVIDRNPVQDAPSSPTQNANPINPNDVRHIIDKVFTGQELDDASGEKGDLYNKIKNSGISERDLEIMWEKAQNGTPLDNNANKEKREIYNMMWRISNGKSINDPSVPTVNTDIVAVQDVKHIIEKAVNGITLDNSDGEKGKLYNEIAEAVKLQLTPNEVRYIWQKVQNGEHLDSPTQIKRNLYNMFKAILNGESIAGFDTGGMLTGAFSGGKLAMLHEKEIVLNKQDTKNLLSAVNIVRNFASMLPKFKLPNINLGNQQLAGATTVNMTVNIDRIEGGQQGANTFFKTIEKGFKERGLKF